MKAIAQATTISLTIEERRALEALGRSRKSEGRTRERARIVLMAASGMASRATDRELGCTPGTVSKWRVRFATQRPAGLSEMRLASAALNQDMAVSRRSTAPAARESVCWRRHPPTALPRVEAIVTAHDRAALRMLPQRDQPHLASSVPRLRPRIASSGTAPAIAVCYGVRMSKRQDQMIAGFTTGERDYIRRQLDIFFSTLPSVAEGFHFKTWRGGPDAGSRSCRRQPRG